MESGLNSRRRPNRRRTGDRLRRCTLGGRCEDHPGVDRPISGICSKHKNGIEVQFLNRIEVGNELGESEDRFLEGHHVPRQLAAHAAKDGERADRFNHAHRVAIRERRISYPIFPGWREAPTTAIDEEGKTASKPVGRMVERTFLSA